MGLNLRRRGGEDVLIVTPDGSVITVRVGRISGGVVELSVQAPPGVLITRSDGGPPVTRPALERHLPLAARDRLAGVGPAAKAREAR